MSESQFVQWLLGARTPTIRYLALRELLGRPETDAEVQAAWHEMKVAGPIPAILAGQTEDGHWAGERGYYTPKYVSTHWSMLLLAELAADPAGLSPTGHGGISAAVEQAALGVEQAAQGSVPAPAPVVPVLAPAVPVPAPAVHAGAASQAGGLRRGAAFMLAATQDELERAIEKGAHGLSCFWGNLLRYALHCGYGDDARVPRIARYLAHDAEQGGWRCVHNDELPCAWGAARALWGLAALPTGQRSPEADGAIQVGLAFLLEAHHLVEADYPTSGRVHPLWFRLNFPLFYQADILFVLRVLAELKALDHPGARPALEWLASRRGANERWRGASPFRQRTWPALADREETDRWVSLQAAIVLG